jgi:hypothetical protein
VNASSYSRVRAKEVECRKGEIVVEIVGMPRLGDPSRDRKGTIFSIV